MDIDFNIKCQIREDINNIDKFLSLDPFHNIIDKTIQLAIFTKIMIDLRDLVRKAEIYANTKFNYNDDIYTNKCVKNISDLIAYIRNALCHIDSDNHEFEKGITLSFSVITCKNPKIIEINGKYIGSNYDDDIGIVFGSQRIYYKRHIIRIFEECKQIFKDIS